MLQPGPSLDLEYVAAQQLSASAYRNATERVAFDFASSGVSWVDDRVMTVTGFVYLAVRSVRTIFAYMRLRLKLNFMHVQIFTTGWNAVASTFFNQAVDVLLSLPAERHVPHF